jgi:hypothetical protein
MAVTINEMQVDVQPRPAATNAPAPPAVAKEPMNFRGQKEMLAERELRLRAD